MPTTFSAQTLADYTIFVMDNSYAGCRLLAGDWVVVSHSVAGLSANTPYYVSGVGSVYNPAMANPSAFWLSETYLGAQIEATSATSGVAHVKILRPHLNGRAVDFNLANAPINFSTDNVKNTIHIETPTGVESKLKIDDRVYVLNNVAGLVSGNAYWVVSSTFLTGALGHDLKLSLTRGGLPATITATIPAAAVGVPLLLAGPLNELSGAAAHPTTGDWRKIIAGTMDGMYQKWSNLEEADRPKRLSMTRTNGVTGNFSSLTYTVKLTLAAQGVDAIAHE
jgi:hypothetical protein